MAVISVSEFRQVVENACSTSDSVMRLWIISETKRQIRIRVFLENRTFLDLYYSSKTGKTAFAQIKDNERIFGADNTEGIWHWHPYEDPHIHDFTNAEITFDEFLKRVDENQSK